MLNVSLHAAPLPRRVGCASATQNRLGGVSEVRAVELTMNTATRLVSAPQRLSQAGRSAARRGPRLVVRALAVPDQYG